MHNLAPPQKLMTLENVKWLCLVSHEEILQRPRRHTIESSIGPRGCFFLLAGGFPVESNTRHEQHVPLAPLCFGKRLRHEALVMMRATLVARMKGIGDICPLDPVFVY